MSEQYDGTIRPENVERLTFQQRLAEANGFSLPPPIYALGTPVLEIGRENFRKSRQSFDALPHASTVIAPFLQRIAGEARADATVRVSDLAMTDDGRLTRKSGDPSRRLFFDSARSLRSLLERTPCEEPGAAATYLACVPADRRASEVNEWLRAADDKSTAVLRTRLALATLDRDDQSSETTALALAPQAYGREVFAVVSERYGTGLEVDKLAAHLQDAITAGMLPGDARGEITYDGRAATIRALWHSNIDPRDACAGEVFKAGVSIRSADDRSEGISVDAALWRNLCLNFMIIGTANRNFGTRRHTGDTRDLLSWLAGAIRAASQSLTGFAGLWDKSRAMRLDSPSVTRNLPEDTADHASIVAGIFRDLMARKVIALTGSRGEDSVTKYVGSWRKEPEFNRAGIINAITRTAHEIPMRGAFASDDLETAAGVILASARPFEYVERGGEVF